jgi:hypothetical protein
MMAFMFVGSSKANAMGFSCLTDPSGNRSLLADNSLIFQDVYKVACSLFRAIEPTRILSKLILN